MLFNNNVNGDLRSFMYYKGEYYINGTEVILSDDYIHHNLFDGKKYRSTQDSLIKLHIMDVTHISFAPIKWIGFLFMKWDLMRMSKTIMRVIL